jgi:hypothetical protein
MRYCGKSNKEEVSKGTYCLWEFGGERRDSGTMREKVMPIYYESIGRLGYEGLIGEGLALVKMEMWDKMHIRADGTWISSS